MEFKNPPLSIDDQIALLIARGLVINDLDVARHWLRNIGFYRLNLHWTILQRDTQRHLFLENTTFENAINLYNLDRELRLFAFSGIEIIEVGFKARINNEMSLLHGAWWFENDILFKNRGFFIESQEDIDKEIGRSTDEFIVSHRHTYQTPQRPPSWKVFEILSIGTVSKIYKNLQDIPGKKSIAISMLLPNYLWAESWLVSISVLRNLCAHHSRIWGRRFQFPPKTMSNKNRRWIEGNSNIANDKEYLYYQLCAIKYLVNIMYPDNKFTDQLQSIITRYEALGIDFEQIGMEKNWFKEAVWS